MGTKPNLKKREERRDVKQLIHQLEGIYDVEDDGRSIRRVIKALGKWGGAEAIGPILDSTDCFYDPLTRNPYYSGEDWEDYYSFVKDIIPRVFMPALVKIGERNGSYALIKALDHSNPGARLALVMALGRMGCTEAVEALIVALKDKWPINREAARALGDIGDTIAIKPLLQAWEDTVFDPSVGTKRAITRALKKIRPGEERNRGRLGMSYRCPCCGKLARTSMNLSRHMLSMSDQRHIDWIKESGLSLVELLGSPKRRGNYRLLAEILEKKSPHPSFQA